jgi:maltooligosyltrehalose trehalohydrolase
MYKELLRLRREEAVFRRVQRRGDLDGAVLGSSAFVLRYFAERHDDDRLVLVNFGVDLHLDIAPEPLLAPPLGKRWTTQFSTEDPKYLGHGTPSLETEDEGWLLPGRCTVVLQPLPAQTAQVTTRVVKSGAAQADEQ